MIIYLDYKKGIIRILIWVRTRDTCGEHIKILKLLPLISRYIFSLALFVVVNKNLLMEYSQIHNIKTRNNPYILQLSSH
jgi:hypothetical protein